MIFKKRIYLIFISLLFFKQLPAKVDVRIYGSADKSDALGSIALDMIEILKDHYNLEFHWLAKQFNLSKGTLNGVSPEVRSIIYRGSTKKQADVALMTHFLMHQKKHPLYEDVKKAKLKIAITMFETDAIPQGWVEIINDTFDMVIVPDEFLVGVYQNSGVKKPIFAVPLAMDLEEFLKHKPKKAPGAPFIFTSSSAFYERKNHMRILQAFSEEFGKNNEVRLILHGHYANPTIYGELLHYIRAHHLSNVHVHNHKIDPRHYVSSFAVTDCYVFASRGEGFSKTPREALALGIPCILTNNTSHKTICNTGFVRPVPADILRPSYVEAFKKVVGHNFDCTVKDLRAAMRDVYHHYGRYLKRAHKGREWVKQYQVREIAPLYRTLVKPKEIILGKVNKITPEYVMTSSPHLFEKYHQIIDAQ